MGRPLPSLLVFLALAFVIISLAMGAPLPSDHSEINISDDQKEVRETGDAPEDEPGLLERTAKGVHCVATIGGAELLFDSCSEAFGGTSFDPTTYEVGRTITDGLGDFVSLMASVLTFDVPGAPTWVRWAISMPIVGTVSYIVLSLLRGAG